MQIVSGWFLTNVTTTPIKTPPPAPALVHKLTEWKGACPLLATACTACKALTADTCQLEHTFCLLRRQGSFCSV